MIAIISTLYCREEKQERDLKPLKVKIECYIFLKKNPNMQGSL